MNPRISISQTEFWRAGVRVMRMNDSCIALAISREASQTTATPRQRSMTSGRRPVVRAPLRALWTTLACHLASSQDHP